MPGIVESLSFFDRVDLLRTWTNEIVQIIGATKKPMQVDDVLDQVSDKLGAPTSEVKYALSYAESQGIVRIDNFTDEVSVTNAFAAA